MEQIEKYYENCVEKVSQIFKDKNIAAYLQKQIHQMFYKYSNTYIFLVSVEDEHLFIYFHKSQARTTKDTDDQEKNISNSEPFHYLIRITRGFPLYGLRLHLIKSHNLQPSINDCRDLLYEVLGDTWNHKRTLSEILDKIPHFQQKMASRNQNYLRMQHTGQFQLGDIYSPLQFKKFQSLETFQDFCPNNQKMIIGTTHTHILIFKLNTKLKSHTNRKYFLAAVCQFQCVHSIEKDDQDKSLKITLLKYRKVKNFYEYDKVYIHCAVEQYDKLIRNILKYITKLEKVQINLDLSSNWRNQDNFESIENKIKECKEVEQMMLYAGAQDRSLALKKLSKNYQKIIEYFSARASSYYLIYVNKLNNLFSQNKQLGK